MCLKTKQPTIPKVQEAPRPDPAAAIAETTRRTRGAQGVYGNIATSPLGDSNYGMSAASLPKLATFGGAA